MRADVPDGHPARIECEDLVVQAGQSGLALADQLRLKGPVTITRGAHIDGPQVSLHPLGARAVADVRAAGPPARRMPEMLGQLRAQRGLDHPSRQQGQQAPRARDLLRRQALQRVLKRRFGQQTREAINRLLRTLSPRSLVSLSFPIRDGLDGHRCPSRPQGPNRSPRPHTLHRTDPPRNAGETVVIGVIDDHTRLAYCELHASENGANVAATLGERSDGSPSRAAAPSKRS